MRLLLLGGLAEGCLLNQILVHHDWLYQLLYDLPSVHDLVLLAIRRRELGQIH
jgi:hypothetical protein